MHAQTVTSLKRPITSPTVDTTAERNTRRVLILTAVTMLAEIAAGTLSGSMALLADGWHMGTHAFALGITLAAYALARKYSEKDTFSFGTGRFGVLAGYTSALFLGAAGAVMIFESIDRMVHPAAIAFDQAIIVAIVGFAVNALSLKMLHGSSGHEHHTHEAQHHASHDHPHSHTHEKKTDHNLKAAYLHVLADALTSVLAIAALCAGRFFGLSILDPAMGIVGGVLILRWSFGLVKTTGLILLDKSAPGPLIEEIREAVESDGNSRLADCRVWPVSSDSYAAEIVVVESCNRSAREYRERCSEIHELSHCIIEVHGCDDPECECTPKRI